MSEAPHAGQRKKSQKQRTAGLRARIPGTAGALDDTFASEHSHGGDDGTAGVSEDGEEDLPLAASAADSAYVAGTERTAGEHAALVIVAQAQTDAVALQTS
jgi:hypothetical protein